MKPNIAIPLGVAGILAAIGTTIANANGMFSGHPSLAYWFWGGSLALIAIAVIGWVADWRKLKAKTSPHEAPADDLRVEPLAFKRGLKIIDISTETVIFLKLSILSDDDTGIKEMGIICEINGQVFSGKPMADLSEWFVQTPFNSPEFIYKTSEEHCLEKLSLWETIQQAGLKSGLVKRGWVGFRIPEMVPLKDTAVIITLCLTKPKQREPYRFKFSEWPESEEVVFHISYKQL